MKKEGGRGPDYVQERTGHTLRCFSHGFSHGMTLNSNIFISMYDLEMSRNFQNSLILSCISSISRVYKGSQAPQLKD